MATIFSDPELWQHGDFTFTVHDGTTTLNSRGNAISAGREITVTFKFKPSGKQPLIANSEPGTGLTEEYQCRVVAVDGDKEKVLLPVEIKPGDVGTGILNQRPCRVVVKGIGQSSLSPILSQILGESIKLDVSYQIRRES
ncbi:MAG: hypothetical protein F6K31_10710 [Symploca sp. SIO2G7]|nr:hypothetical protein [Symploca sp. SIO2G7]